MPTGDSGHLVLPDDCVWPPPDSRREKSQTGGRPRPRADKFVAKSIVRNNGGALRHVEPELKGDRDVVLAAVRNSGRALEHASPSLRNDAAVVKVAVTQDATALRFASHKLRCDPDVFETAMASQGSRYGWGDSPKRSPTKSSSMEFPAPLSPKARTSCRRRKRRSRASRGGGRWSWRVRVAWLSLQGALFTTLHHNIQRKASYDGARLRLLRRRN